jgi:phage shock protein C
MEAFRRQGLVRPRQGRILGGVCAGLARRFGMNATMMRILFIVTLIVIPGSQIIVYPILWILMPSE